MLASFRPATSPIAAGSADEVTRVVASVADERPAVISARLQDVDFVAVGRSIFVFPDGAGVGVDRQPEHACGAPSYRFPACNRPCPRTGCLSAPSHRLSSAGICRRGCLGPARGRLSTARYLPEAAGAFGEPMPMYKHAVPAEYDSRRFRERHAVVHPGVGHEDVPPLHKGVTVPARPPQRRGRGLARPALLRRVRDALDHRLHPGSQIRTLLRCR